MADDFALCVLIFVFATCMIGLFGLMGWLLWIEFTDPDLNDLEDVAAEHETDVLCILRELKETGRTYPVS